MRSRNGRHRRPRQAPALFVTAGVTGAGLAIPLLGATGAQAADTDTWDRVAQCESGGMWSAETGNGYYGGLQFTPQMWEDFGGRDYAPRADLASRSQQIAVAEKVLAAEGPDAWPRCAVNAGLSEGGEAPDVDPGGLDLGIDLGLDLGRPDSTESPTSGPRDSSGPDKSEKPDGKGDSDVAEPGPSPDASESSTPAPRTGKHRGGAADEEQRSGKGGQDAGADAGGEGRESGRHASRGDTSDSSQSAADHYTVRPGDNLSAIAAEHSLPGGWHELYDANVDVVGAEPDLIHPGQQLVLGG